MNEYELIIDMAKASRCIIFNADRYSIIDDKLYAFTEDGMGEEIAKFSPNARWTIVNLSSKKVGKNETP